jgi:hypothetical protein
MVRSALDRRMLPCTQTPVSHALALKLLNGKAKEKEKKKLKK